MPSLPAEHHIQQARGPLNSGAGPVLKRALDVSVGCLSLMVLALPLALIALLVRLDSRGPVFFRQQRIGRDGNYFRVWKFRTMVDAAESQGLGVTVSQDDWRITRVGRVLRDWGLDELPQLINVVRGEMSIVGPRPTLGYQVEQYDDFQHRRLLAKPGVTGLAVVRGRNSLAWVERIQHDVWYIDHWSFWLDLKIIALTFWKVLVTREGLYGADGVNDDFTSATHATSPAAGDRDGDS